MSKKYLLIDPCYLGETQLKERYGAPVAIYRTGDGVFEFEGQKVSVDSGEIHIYEIADTDDLPSADDFVKNPFAEIACISHCPSKTEIDKVVYDAITVIDMPTRVL